MRAEQGAARTRRCLIRVDRSISGVTTTLGGSDVGLATGALRAGAVAFEQVLEGGDAADVLRRYRGRLVPGFFVESATGFQRWLDEQRSHGGGQRDEATARRNSDGRGGCAGC